MSARLSSALSAVAVLTLTLALPSAARAESVPEVPSESTPTGDAPSSEGASSLPPPKERWDIYDVHEDPGRRYVFLGLRYRGNIVPQFVLNTFVEGGRTVFTNIVGAELELRKDGFSVVPAISFHELGTGDLLVKQKDTRDIVGNYALVNSQLKLVYASVDLLWSTRLGKHVEFEYGVGLGLGAVLGDLQNSWVSEDPSGPFASEGGRRFRRCDAVGPPGSGCNSADHQNSRVNKVGGYAEPSWFDGGAKPALFPWVSLPQLGLRVKPTKQVVARVGVGLALTGAWFGLSAQYGLEKRPE